MIWVRKSLAALLSLLLLALLLATVLSYNLNSNFSTSNNIKVWLSQSKIYDHFVAQVIQQSQKSIGGNGQTDSISLSDAAVQQAAQTTFSSQLLQTSVNTILDANYAWLQGKTATPVFNINFSDAKNSFAQQVGNIVKDRFTSLPVCSAAQLAQLTTTDPMSVPCRPASVSPATEGTLVTQQIANSTSFLPNPFLNADNIQPRNGEPYYKQLSFAPKLYQAVQKIPIVLAGVDLLAAIAILFLLPRRKGLRRLAVIFTEVGLLLIAVKFATDWLDKRFVSKLFDSNSVGQLQSSLTSAIHLGEAALAKIDLYFGIGFLAIAVLIFIILFLTKGKGKKAATAPAQQTSAPTDTNTTAGDQQAGVASADMSASPRPMPVPSRSLDINSPAPAQVAPRPQASTPNTAATTAPTLTSAKPKRPRLIQ